MAKFTVANVKDTLPEMPLAPGNIHAAEKPPAHVTAPSVLPYMTPEKQRWTKDRVASMDKAMQDRAGTFEVKLKDVESDESELRRAASAIVRPKGLRNPR